MAFTTGQYNSTGFSIQRDEIISIQQPKNTDIFYVQVGSTKRDFVLTEFPDKFMPTADKLRLWVNNYPVHSVDADGTVKWTFDEYTKTITMDIGYSFLEQGAASIRVEYYRPTRQFDGDTSSNYEDGVLRQLAKDLLLHPYEVLTNGEPKIDGNGFSETDQPYTLVYPYYAGSCAGAVDPSDGISLIDPQPFNKDACEQLENGVWSTVNSKISINTEGKQNVDSLLASINTINNMFVVESEKGTDLLSSVKDVINSTPTIPASTGSQPAGLSVKRKPQKWRIRFYYDQNDNYLHVNVGTKYQILDNGKISNTELRDGIKAITMRLPGELCDVYLDTQTGSMKNKSGFFRRQGKESSEFEGTYPLSYRLTTTDHGTMFYMWDHASVGQADDFAWFVVQRHVDNRTGRIDLEDGYSPVHCIYSPAKRPVNGGDVRWLQGDLLSPIGSVYSTQGSTYEREDEAWIVWNTQVGGVFGGGERNDIFYISGDNAGDIHPSTSTYTFPFSTDGTESFYAAGHVNSRLGQEADPLNLDGGNVYTYTIQGGNYPASASADVLQNNFPSIPRPDRMSLTVNRIEVERARSEEFFLDSKGVVDWNEDNFNWSGTSRNSYVYDPIEHKIIFRNPIAPSDKVELRYYSYSSDSSSLGTYMVQIPEDAELPEYNLHTNSLGKAIYRFIVRERDIFKPWDIHKSATMTTIDSPSIINPMEQMSITPSRRFIYTFPTPLVTQRFVYATSELDLISYSSADSSAFSGQALIGSGNNQKYLFDRVSSIDGTYDGGSDILNFRAPYDWHSYRCSVGTCDGVGEITKVDCAGVWVDSRQVYGWPGNLLDYNKSTVDDSVLTINQEACVSAGGNWSSPSRVYQGMMSTLPNGNGMRIFMLVRGGPVHQDYSDVVVLD